MQGASTTNCGSTMLLKYFTALGKEGNFNWGSVKTCENFFLATSLRFGKLFLYLSAFILKKLNVWSRIFWDYTDKSMALCIFRIYATTTCCIRRSFTKKKLHGKVSVALPTACTRMQGETHVYTKKHLPKLGVCIIKDLLT